MTSIQSFKDLNLNPKILAALDSKGYTTPTPIQLQSIPHLLEHKDLLGIAQTGTGKTAAFSLPILHNLTESNVSVKSGGVRTLILTPTRELASQIADNIELYGKDLNLRHVVIFGGVNERPQIAAMKRGVDILIATPGRLLDLMSQGHIRYMQLEVLVLDEADRMLDMGFIHDIKKIIAKLPKERQTLFFSATMPDSITSLANSILNNPTRVEITPQSTTVERIDQRLNYVAKSNKPQLLKRIIKQDDATSVLVFSKTKHGANRIQEFLEKSNIKVAAIHGNKSQSAREKALDSFREGKVQVLIATDIAARGIDVPSISYVVNYDVPMDPESYVHRIGRTARAGKKGVAISFCDPSELKLLKAVEETIKFKIPVDETHPFHDVAPAQSSGLGSRTRKRDDQPSRSETRRRDDETSEPRTPRPKSGGRKYGYSVNKERKIASTTPRGFKERDDRNGNFKPKTAANGNSRSRDEDNNGILGLVGSWFKGKKPDSRKTGERSNSSESSGNRSRPTSSGSRGRSNPSEHGERSHTPGQRSYSNSERGNSSTSSGNRSRPTSGSRGRSNPSEHGERSHSPGQKNYSNSGSRPSSGARNSSRPGSNNTGNRRPSGNRKPTSGGGNW